jgi:hypothetical protein
MSHASRPASLASPADSVASQASALQSPTSQAPPSLIPSHEVAAEIARQIGPQAFAMMGTTQKVADGPHAEAVAAHDASGFPGRPAGRGSLTFNVRSSRRWTKIRITLDFQDTYTVEFFRIGGKFGLDIKTGGALEGIYADDLHGLIEAETGLYLSLAPRRS